MEADNQNKWNSLQSKLEGLTEMPGEPAFDSNSAWNKLSGRLEKKAIHRKPIFYWAAAAILLLIFSVTLYQFRQPTENKLVNHSPNNPRSSSLPSDAEFKNLDAGAAKQSFQPEQKITTPQIRRNPSYHIAKKLSHKPVSSAITTVINQPVSNQEDSPVVAASILPDPNAVVKASPVKLKVIHNNRLNSVIYKQELSVSNAPTAFPPSSGNLRFSRNASDNIIQIKLSLTN